MRVVLFLWCFLLGWTRRRIDGGRMRAEEESRLDWIGPTINSTMENHNTTQH